MKKTEIYPDFNCFKEYSKKGNIIPIYRDISADLETPVSTFLKLASKETFAYLLESVEGGERWGRYSFISWSPKYIFQSRKEKYSISERGSKQQWESTPDPLGELKKLLSQFMPVEVDGLPRFWGGAVGYVSYDMVRFFEKLSSQPKDILELPESFFMLTDKLVVFDHLAHIVKVIVCVDLRNSRDARKSYQAAEREIESIVSSLRKPLKAETTRSHENGKIKSNLSPSRFRKMVEKVKEYIRSGDVVQTVVSQRFSRRTHAPAFDIYRSLRLMNPSPYMYFLKAGDFDIIGSSPEILVRKEDSIAETRPIAGTRPRGANEYEDDRLSKELLSDPKERAEHIMLVDLGRNDLARVCEPSSVAVPQLMTIEKYSHVIHIVSSVVGTLKPGMDSFEVFRVCFPAGTVSGAPKVRAMEIIDELEPSARGPYAGAVGYFSYSGNMDMAITIRTIVLKDGIAHCQAGAGIVADSVPENEYKETKNKAAALFAAIDKAEHGK